MPLSITSDARGKIVDKGVTGLCQCWVECKFTAGPPTSPAVKRLLRGWGGGFIIGSRRSATLGRPGGKSAS